MTVSVTSQSPSVKLFYTNPHSAERRDDQAREYSLSEAIGFLSQLTQPNVLLITTMPSGLGLDFHSEHDGSIWIEFYGDVLQSTFTDLVTAQKILEHAFNSTSSGPVLKIFSALVRNWEY